MKGRRIEIQFKVLRVSLLVGKVLIKVLNSLLQSDN